MMMQRLPRQLLGWNGDMSFSQARLHETLAKAFDPSKKDRSDVGRASAAALVMGAQTWNQLVAGLQCLRGCWDADDGSMCYLLPAIFASRPELIDWAIEKKQFDWFLAQLANRDTYEHRSASRYSRTFVVLSMRAGTFTSSSLARVAKMRETLPPVYGLDDITADLLPSTFDFSAAHCSMSVENRRVFVNDMSEMSSLFLMSIRCDLSHPNFVVDWTKVADGFADSHWSMIVAKNRERISTLGICAETVMHDLRLHDDQTIADLTVERAVVRNSCALANVLIKEAPLNQHSRSLCMEAFRAALMCRRRRCLASQPQTIGMLYIADSVIDMFQSMKFDSCAIESFYNTLLICIAPCRSRSRILDAIFRHKGSFRDESFRWLPYDLCAHEDVKTAFKKQYPNMELRENLKGLALGSHVRLCRTPHPPLRNKVSRLRVPISNLIGTVSELGNKYVGVTVRHGGEFFEWRAYYWELEYDLEAEQAALAKRAAAKRAAEEAAAAAKRAAEQAAAKRAAEQKAAMEKTLALAAEVAAKKKAREEAEAAKKAAKEAELEKAEAAKKEAPHVSCTIDITGDLDGVDLDHELQAELEEQEAEFLKAKAICDARAKVVAARKTEREEAERHEREQREEAERQAKAQKEREEQRAKAIAQPGNRSPVDLPPDLLLKAQSCLQCRRGGVCSLLGLAVIEFAKQPRKETIVFLEQRKVPKTLVEYVYRLNSWISKAMASEFRVPEERKTVQTNGIPYAPTRKFDQNGLLTLERFYNTVSNYPEQHNKQAMAIETGRSYYQVANWFMSRRGQEVRTLKRKKKSGRSGASGQRTKSNVAEVSTPTRASKRRAGTPEAYESSEESEIEVEAEVVTGEADPNAVEVEAVAIEPDETESVLAKAAASIVANPPTEVEIVAALGIEPPAPDLRTKDEDCSATTELMDAIDFGDDEPLPAAPALEAVRLRLQGVSCVYERGGPLVRYWT